MVAPVYYQGGKILWRDGKLARAADCCCVPTCCPEPPEEMLVSFWTGRIGDIGIGAAGESLIVPGGGPFDGACETIETMAPYTLARGGSPLGDGFVPADCPAIAAWRASLPGTPTAFWSFGLEDWGQFQVVRTGPPFNLVFGCEDLEDEMVHLYIQLALRTIEGECWYFGQLAWYTIGTTPTLCRHYDFVGDKSITEHHPEEDCADVVNYLLTLDRDASSETAPEHANQWCWGCSVLHSELSDPVPADFPCKMAISAP